MNFKKNILLFSSPSEPEHLKNVVLYVERKCGDRMTMTIMTIGNEDSAAVAVV